jgi:hypothetical protein
MLLGLSNIISNSPKCVSCSLLEFLASIGSCKIGGLRAILFKGILVHFISHSRGTLKIQPEP